MNSKTSGSSEKPYCTRCRGEIHPEALACPHCRAEFTNTEAYKKKQEAEGNASCLGIVFAIILIGGGVIWAMF